MDGKIKKEGTLNTKDSTTIIFRHKYTIGNKIFFFYGGGITKDVITHIHVRSPKNLDVITCENLEPSYIIGNDTVFLYQVSSGCVLMENNIRKNIKDLNYTDET